MRVAEVEMRERREAARSVSVHTALSDTESADLFSRPNPRQNGGSRMITGTRRTQIFQRPTRYPLPLGLLTGFWDR
ncbi:hypothetical protein AMJ40_07665 [candidate division TA06 bacterium DG_26]|uniref:Uncharacterized protein n=1 Tax=candidate division TA06 bacterium DG_26 TaxID=1703771 RepID=A0A0S7WDX2_UNCT6|nr:MAG: hypothetical protein AMJ40_07665 [candidate division TA06 bacterium DG_26]